MPTFRLIMRSGPSVGKEFPLEKTELYVGRDLNNDIVINDPEVSRRHARFYVQGNTYILEDLGSTNGTFINGQRLVSPYPMRGGEVITFGERINVVYEAASLDEGATVVAASARPPEPPFQPPVQPPVQPQYQEPYRQPVQPVYPPQPYPQQQQAQQAQASYPPQTVSEEIDFPGEQLPYAGQVPGMLGIFRTPSQSRTVLIIIAILLVVICLCVSVFLWFAPESFWCTFPVWPDGYCP